MTGIQIFCKCGGSVSKLCPDKIICVISEDNEIIFRGICDDCGEGVNVHFQLIELMHPKGKSS